MRLNGVEIKVSLAESEVQKAVRALHLGEDGKRRSIGFIEDKTVGASLPLFRQGIVLRVREMEDEGDDEDDSTVKLRPCRWSQLTSDWLDKEAGDGWKLRVEQDWAGSRRVLAASCVSDLPEGRIASVRNEEKPPARRLFSEGQEQFLSDCAGMRINLDALTLLPPIAATRWEDVEIDDVKDIVVERWKVGNLDFLELSLKKDAVEEAKEAQAELELAMTRLGLERDDEQKSKTEQVLAYLARLER
jgi:hypothetical protein